MAALDTGPGDLDVLFDVLSQPERRRVLLHLSDVGPRDDDQVTLDELVAGDPDREREHLQTDLHHRHLPKLDDARFVRWAPEDRTVRRGPRFDEVEPVLELLQDQRDDLSDDRS